MLTFDDIRGVGVSRMMMSAFFFQNQSQKQNRRTDLNPFEVRFICTLKRIANKA